MTGMPDRETRVSSDKMMVESSYSDFGIAYSSAEDGTNSRISEAAFGSQAAMVLSYGFEAGDMVWGKVKSHPWWPGHIFCEAFASPSVRRSKREGHVLVAFFGDSSYGWFDLAELIPFEPNFAEKSRQTSSRNFVRAVEEAVDESCRRQALGLTCRCRSQFNFRPTSVQGYFSVDVPGYEQGAVYSVQQIKKARDKFQPTEVLSFVQQLATIPRNGDHKALDWISYRATILAFRKASFEEFDETYAQAFGVQPARPSTESVNGSNQGARMPSRAPLSGPLVVAEALGKSKGFGRLTKIKEQSRKDKYLFKRRDEPDEPRDFHNVPAQTNLVVSSAYGEGPTITTSSDYVFQKRTPDVSVKPDNESKQEGPGNDGTGGAALAGDTCWQENDVGSSLAATEFSLADVSLIDPPSEVGVDHPANEPVANAIVSSSLEDGRLYADIGSSMYEMDGISKSDATARVLATGQDKSMMSRSQGFMNYADHNFEAHDQYKQALSLPSENQSGLYQVSDGGHFRTVVETVGASHVSNKVHGASGINTDALVKKKKVLKRPAEDGGSNKSNTGTAKKKKRKEMGIESSSENAQRRLKTLKDGELPRKSAGKSLGIGSTPWEKSQADQQSRENGAGSNFLFDSVVQSQPEVDLENVVVEFPQLLDDLMALALDPYYGAERNSPTIARDVFLRFRSLVYQKSLFLAPPSEAEMSDLGAHRSAVIESADILPVEDVKALPSKRRPKHFKRPDDPTVSGRKRNLSDRQEEMSVKRVKKINDLKALSSEKKNNNLKMQEMQLEQKDATDQKDASTTAANKLAKPNLVKKQELPAKLFEPTMLVMKFPPRTTLPSINELKAKFGRFGPLDHSAMRVFWKSSQCRVVFRHKDHAQAALNYAMQNRALFGHVKVSYNLRGVEAPAQEAAEPNKADEGIGDATGALLRRPPQPAIQLKSILKKPFSGGADELGGASRGSPRVKFLLGGEESSRADQSMVTGSSSSRDLNKNDGGGSSSLAMDINSKNFQKLVPSVPLLQPNFVGPPRVSSSSSSLSSRITEMHETQQIRGLGHFAKPPPFSESEPINNNNYRNTNTTTSNNKKNPQTNTNTNTNAAMKKFTQKFVDMMKAEELFESLGGPIILAQVNWAIGFTEFGGAVPYRPAEDFAFSVAKFIQTGGSFVKLLLHGKLIFLLSLLTTSSVIFLVQIGIAQFD
ncbi:hypothetical protein Scep_007808 [Stephania cephalantha]|uniref:PWWP domain-containing protein n=1 Tax=Stephania cephalantha TaxID=152367 RepID=A0AAP0PQE0_9MAGN